MSASHQAVFLSYASQDAEAARRIRDALQAVGLDVWFDQSALRGGDAWDASIRRQIKECALFIPVISANTQVREEGYFRLEWKLAVDRSHLMADEKAFLLPVVIDAMLDVNARVPQKFREVQWTHLPLGETPTPFAERVQRLLAGGAASLSAAPARLPLAAASASTTAGHEAPSIAVLPFVNMSRDEENEYFADGLSEELLNVLAKIRGLRVASRTSAFSFKGRNVDIPTVAQKLNVATVLEGSVRKSGKRVRITAQLIEVQSDSHLWSATYDRELDDILSFQLYLQGRFFGERHTQADTDKAIELYRRALVIDPDFALAWAGLSHIHQVQAGFGFAPIDEGYERAREAAQHALRLAPDAPEGHVALGQVQELHDWNWAAADASYRRALELAPGDGRALLASASLARILGRIDAGLELIEKAITLDPLSPRTHRQAAMIYLCADRVDAAASAFELALDLNPTTGLIHAFLAITRLLQGRAEEGLTLAQSESHHVFRNVALAMSHHTLGHRAQSDAAMQALIAGFGWTAAYQVAEVYAWRKEIEEAFEWLERAYAQRDPGVVYTAVDILLEPMHGDPRWQPFLQRMHLA